MSSHLSIFILTLNSERRLSQVLDAAKEVADEIVIVDSGSTDKTIEILSRYAVRTLHRDFDNFRDQRVYAEDACSSNWILALDSDEVLSAELIDEIKLLKERDFKTENSLAPDVFGIRRDWYFLDYAVRNFYPTKTPEYICRLYRKDKVSYRGSRIIHEALQIDNCLLQPLDKPMKHFTCDSIDDLYRKVGLYTSLSAQDMYDKGERSSWVKINIYPWLVWAQWYFIYGSWRDGYAGIVVSRYIRITIYLKYLKLKHIVR